MKLIPRSKSAKRKLIVKGLTVAGSFAAKKVFENYVDKKTSKTIPNEPDKENDQTWKQALIYAAVTGAVLSTVKLAIGRAADRKLEQIL